MAEDYVQLVKASVLKLGELTRQRDELEAQIAKLNQFISATLNMLPDEERERLQVKIDFIDARNLGLTDAVRKVLQHAPRHAWVAGTEIRKTLIEAGFDFSEYTSNPLASIYAVAKRFKPQEVETDVIDGVRAFRWKGFPPPPLTAGTPLKLSKKK
jgi:hypothetical protein